MRRRPRPATAELRAAVREALRAAVQGKPQADLARALGISRQRLHSYVRGKSVPRPDLLAAMCETLRLTVAFRGRQLSAGSFRVPAGSRGAPPTQGVLFERLIQEPGRLTIAVRRRGKGVELVISVNPAGRRGAA